MSDPSRTKARGRVTGFHLLLGLCAALLATDLVYSRHVSQPWEGVFGFYGIFGFVACVLLVLAARVLRKVVMRSEAYWDD